MRCQNFSNQRNVLFDELNAFNSETVKMNENDVVRVLLLDNKSFTIDMNLRIIITSTCFIKDSKRFDESLSLERNHFDIKV